MDVNSLKEIGLSKNENIAYLTLLKHGMLKSASITKRSGLNPGRIYDILDSLILKGLVSETEIDNVKHFSAAPPDELLTLAQNRIKEVKEQEKHIQSLLPELNRLRHTTLPLARSSVYTGFRGLKTAANEALESMKEGEEILGMGFTQLKDKKVNDFWTYWSTKRTAKKIPLRALFSEKGEYHNTFKKMKYTKTKVLESVTPVAVDIFGSSTVLILNYQDPISVILIQDKNTVRSFTQFFEGLWNTAGKSC